MHLLNISVFAKLMLCSKAGNGTEHARPQERAEGQVQDPVQAHPIDFTSNSETQTTQEEKEAWA